MNPIILFVFAGYCYICYSTAIYYSKRRKVDVILGTLVCIVLSPLIGGFILILFPPKLDKEPEEVEEEFIHKPTRPFIDDPKSITYSSAEINFSEQNKSRPITNPNFNFRFSKKFFLRVSLIIFPLFIVIIILNPGYESFKEFTPSMKTKTHYVLRKRVNNYLLYSVYEITSYDYNDYHEQFIPTTTRYMGFLMNFYPAD